MYWVEEASMAESSHAGNIGSCSVSYVYIENSNVIMFMLDSVDFVYNFLKLVVIYKNRAF